MIKNIRKISLRIIVMALMPMLTSCWWSGRVSLDTTKYNGSRTLANTSYKNLEIHGSAHLSKVQVSGWFNCQGSAELVDTVVDGRVDTSGTLTTRDGSSIKGVVHAPSIKAEETTFTDIFSRSDKNKTYRFTNCFLKNLYIEGLGDKIVILTNTQVESITFENKNGIVKLQGNSKVHTVTNGTIEYSKNLSN